MTDRPTLLLRHGSAWMSDPWYGWAWLIWPQALGLCLIALLFLVGGGAGRPPASSDWVGPTDAASRAAWTKVLRDQARTDPAALALLRDRAEKGDPDAAYSMGTLLDPDLDRQHASLERTQQAIDWYRKAADRNIVTAQTALGFLLVGAKFGMKPDFAQALQWLQIAAPKDPQAQRELGLLYDKGVGVSPDPARAMDLFQSAADRGDPVALAIVGDALDRGANGLVVDRSKAVRYYEKAAAMNNVFAQRELAKHLMSGDGTAVDRTQALFWFKRAAANGDVYAKQQIDNPQIGAPAPIAPPVRQPPPAVPTQDVNALKALRDTARTDPAAEASLRAVAERGDAAAAYFMGTLLDPAFDRQHANLERTKQAIDWYRKAADKGVPQAQANLGALLTQPSPGLEPDYVQAAALFEKASSKVPSAQTRLGLLYVRGQGVPQDKSRGIALIQSAADREEPTALAIIGDAYDHGTGGFVVDKAKALANFEKAAALDNVFSQRQLGIHLRSGDGVAADRKKAIYWFRKAAAQGDAYSKAQIATATR